MDADDARWLVGPEAAEELTRAAAEADPASLAAAERLRRRLPPGRAAAVATQVTLRGRAVAKFGDRAGRLFFTADGVEQASRPRVAAWRARRFAAAGVRRVLDLGCGIGADALAFQDAGLEVIPVELEPVTAILAEANLGIPVMVGDAVDLLPRIQAPDTAVFCDPARRTASGRSWRVEDLNPPWSFVEQLLSSRIACVKLGPGLPHTLVPEGVAATWVSDGGDLVELSLWSGPWPPARTAVLLPGDRVLSAGGSTSAPAPADPSDLIGRVLYEPDPAVIRAGLVDVLAERLGAERLHPGIAYLVGPGLDTLDQRGTGLDTPYQRGTDEPFATAFEVLSVLDPGEKSLRAWVRQQQIGTLEIKKRGLDLDPSALRRRLKPSGPRHATLVLTPTGRGARALVVRRLPTHPATSQPGISREPGEPSP